MKTLVTLICAGLLGFSLFGKETNSAGAQLTIKVVSDFQFGGGNLKDFLKAIRETFEINLEEIATVPNAMLYSVSVPKMRLNERDARLTFRNALALYNTISEKGDPSLGRWIMEGQTILLVATTSRPESPFAVKAFSLPVSDAQPAEKVLEILQRTIYEQADSLRRTKETVGLSDADLRGRLDYHAQAGILVT